MDRNELAQVRTWACNSASAQPAYPSARLHTHLPACLHVCLPGPSGWRPACLPARQHARLPARSPASLPACPPALLPAFLLARLLACTFPLPVNPLPRLCETACCTACPQALHVLACLRYHHASWQLA